MGIFISEGISVNDRLETRGPSSNNAKEGRTFQLIK